LSSLPVPLQIGLLVLLFAVGVVSRRAGWLAPVHGGKMLNLVMTVGLPALFISDVSRMELSRDVLVLPAIAASVMLLTGAAAVALGRWWAVPRASFGSLVICSMAINNGLLFPFVIAGWGSEAFGRLALFDLGNAIMQCTFIYGIAAMYGGHSASPMAIARRVFTFPPLWGLALALAINLSGYQLAPVVTQVLGTGGRLILLLVVLALGILFDVRLARSRLVVAAIGLRIGLGFLLGLAAVRILGLEGLVAHVVLLGCAAPIGFNVVVIANREHLDRELVASAASISVLAALIYVPLALLLGR